MKNYRNIPALIFIIIWNPYCNAKILPCKDSVKLKVCFLVDKPEDYVPTNEPGPRPFLVNTTINVNDIIAVDEEMKTITLALKIILEWYDHRISVNKSEEDQEK